MPYRIIQRRLSDGTGVSTPTSVRLEGSQVTSVEVDGKTFWVAHTAAGAIGEAARAELQAWVEGIVRSGKYPA